MSESQGKVQVMTNRRRGRYTLARCTHEIVAEIAIGAPIVWVDEKSVSDRG